MQVLVEHRCQTEDLPLLPKSVLKAFYRKADIFSQNPDLGKPLVGELKNYRRLSLAGRYRIIYRFDRTKDQVWIISVGIRKEALPLTNIISREELMT